MSHQFVLAELIRDTLSKSKEPDPHVIARRLVARIPDDQLRAVMAECLHDRVREEIRAARMAPTVRASGEPTPGVSRWHRLRYCVEGEWKMLGDCTAEDCEHLALEYERRAAEQFALAERFHRLAADLRAGGVQTVGELGTDLEAAA